MDYFPIILVIHDWQYVYFPLFLTAITVMSFIGSHFICDMIAALLIYISAASNLCNIVNRVW